MNEDLKAEKKLIWRGKRAGEKGERAREGIEGWTQTE